MSTPGDLQESSYIWNLYNIIHWALLEIYKNPLIYSQIKSFPTHLFWIFYKCIYIYIYIYTSRERQTDRERERKGERERKAPILIILYRYYVVIFIWFIILASLFLMICLFLFSYDNPWNDQHLPPAPATFFDFSADRHGNHIFLSQSFTFRDSSLYLNPVSFLRFFSLREDIPWCKQIWQLF